MRDACHHAYGNLPLKNHVVTRSKKWDVVISCSYGWGNLDNYFFSLILQCAQQEIAALRSKWCVIKYSSPKQIKPVIVESDIQIKANGLNNRSRKCLRFSSPDLVFFQDMKAALMTWFKGQNIFNKFEIIGNGLLESQRPSRHIHAWRASYFSHGINNLRFWKN